MARSLMLVLALTVVCAVACSSSPTPTPTAVSTPTPRPTATPTPVAALTATPTPRSTAQPTAAPQPTVVATPTAPTPTETPDTLFLNVASPANESVVSAKEVEVKGQTTPDAVVTVDSQIAEVDATGGFAVKVTLEEGPNTIELLASDFQGNQVSQVIMVVYVPS